MHELTALLCQPMGEGYPTDYLLARVRGRRAAMAAMTRRVPESVTDAEVRENLRKEFHWVYCQMDLGMRDTFAPLFLWFELRSVIVSLRFRRSGDRRRSAAILAAGLLAEQVQRALATEGEPAAAAEALAGILAGIAAPCRELGQVFRERGGRTFEERLVLLYLEGVAGGPFHPLAREFFRGLIDMRNLVTLAKQLRWQLQEPEAFARGGTFPQERLAAASRDGTQAALDLLLAALPDMEPPAVPSLNPEPSLAAWMTRRLRKLGREPLGIGLVLDYLWRRAVEARNLGIFCHGADLDRQAVEAEVVP